MTKFTIKDGIKHTTLFFGQLIAFLFLTFGGALAIGLIFKMIGVAWIGMILGASIGMALGITVLPGFKQSQEKK